MTETVSAVLVPVPDAKRMVSRRVPALRRHLRRRDPHLTVGDRPAGGTAELRTAEAEVLQLLPVSAHVSRVWPMTGGAAPGSWRTVAEFPLAG